MHRLFHIYNHSYNNEQTSVFFYYVARKIRTMQFNLQSLKPNLFSLLLLLVFVGYGFINSTDNSPQNVGKEMSLRDFKEAKSRFDRNRPESFNGCDLEAINIPAHLITAVIEQYGTEMVGIRAFRMHYGMSENGTNLGMITSIDERFNERSSASDSHYAITVPDQVMGPCPHLCD